MPFIEYYLSNIIYEYDTIIEYYYLNMLLLLLFQQILSYLPLALVPPPIIEGQLPLGYPAGCFVFQSVGRSVGMCLSFHVFPGFCHESIVWW